MTKQHYKLIGKLWAAVCLINCETGFSSDEVSENTTEDQLNIIVKEAIRQGDKLLGKHTRARNLGSIEQIAKYVEDLYYY